MVDLHIKFLLLLTYSFGCIVTWPEVDPAQAHWKIIAALLPVVCRQCKREIFLISKNLKLYLYFLERDILEGMGLVYPSSISGN